LTSLPRRFNPGKIFRYHCRVDFRAGLGVLDKRKKNLSSLPGSEPRNRPACSSVDIPTELPQFHILKISLLVKQPM